MIARATQKQAPNSFDSSSFVESAKLWEPSKPLECNHQLVRKSTRGQWSSLGPPQLGREHLSISL